MRADYLLLQHLLNLLLATIDTLRCVTWEVDVLLYIAVVTRVALLFVHLTPDQVRIAVAVLCRW